jgi:hypothetical protein
MHLKGLSPQARYVRAIADDSQRITDPDEAQAYLESI